MNTLPMDETIFRVAVETVESLAMILLVPPEEAPELADVAHATAGVTFGGPRTGELLVTVRGDLLPQLTGNMLGLADGVNPSREQQEDALKELANVLCGNLLPVVLGPSPIFSLEPPSLRSQPPESSSSSTTRRTAGVANLFTEAGAMEVLLFVDEPALTGARA